MPLCGGGQKQVCIENKEKIGTRYITRLILDQEY